ncbi:hypothetical protein DNTS_024633 [Danionella cerebrum]|uniref:Uncharacterized protein n=1 Tax=Danionella cerebrum TaxID=2873325 RepID=A0A553NHM2_9TELE|nr:hypothetical protein DNTS_024633 [Danionella translucida]
MKKGLAGGVKGKRKMFSFSLRCRFGVLRGRVPGQCRKKSTCDQREALEVREEQQEGGRRSAGVGSSPGLKHWDTLPYCRADTAG